MIYIAICDISQVGNLEDDTYRILPQRVLERTRKVANEKQKKERFFAYLTLKELYAKLYPECPLPDIAYTKKGKPYFVAEEKNATAESGVQFNISHSGNIVAVVLSEKREVGIDVQLVSDTKINKDRIEKRLLSDIEIVTEAHFSEEKGYTPPQFQAFFFEPCAKLGRVKSKNGDFDKSNGKKDDVNVKEGASSQTISEEPTSDCECERIEEIIKSVRKTIEEISPKKSVAEFAGKWTVFEASIKMSGGGFSDVKRTREILENSKINTFVLTDKERSKYYLSIASNEI